jgi:hypothetical protein
MRQRLRQNLTGSSAWRQVRAMVASHRTKKVTLLQWAGHDLQSSPVCLLVARIAFNFTL